MSSPSLLLFILGTLMLLATATSTAQTGRKFLIGGIPSENTAEEMAFEPDCLGFGDKVSVKICGTPPAPGPKHHETAVFEPDCIGVVGDNKLVKNCKPRPSPTPAPAPAPAPKHH